MLKKAILGFLLAVAVFMALPQPAQAWGYWHNHHRWHHRRWVNYWYWDHWHHHRYRGGYWHYW